MRPFAPPAPAADAASRPEAPTGAVYMVPMFEGVEKTPEAYARSPQLLNLRDCDEPAFERRMARLAHDEHTTDEERRILRQVTRPMVLAAAKVNSREIAASNGVIARDCAQVAPDAAKQARAAKKEWNERRRQYARALRQARVATPRPRTPGSRPERRPERRSSRQACRRSAGTRRATSRSAGGGPSGDGPEPPGPPPPAQPRGRGDQLDRAPLHRVERDTYYSRPRRTGGELVHVHHLVVAEIVRLSGGAA